MALQSSKKGFLNASYVSSFTSPCFCCAWLDFWEIGGLKSWCEEYSKMWKAASGDLTSFWQSKWSVLSSPRSLRLLCKLQGHCDVHNRFRSWRSRLDTIAHLSRKPKDLLRLPVEIQDTWSTLQMSEKDGQSPVRLYVKLFCWNGKCMYLLGQFEMSRLSLF